jgi:hypothetical protein
MLRKVVCAALVLAVSIGFAAAEEMMGAITKVEDGKITVRKFGKKKKGEEVVLTLASKVKVKEATGKFNKEEKKFEVTVGDDLKDGLKNDRFAKIGKFGVFAQIITNDDGKVTNINVLPPFKGKGKGKKKPSDDK